VTIIAPRLIARLRLAAVAVLGGVVCAAVAGLGYASANGPASAQQYQYRTQVCHHTGSTKNPHRTLTISSRAVPAHLRHGDTPGPCPTTTNIARHSQSAHVKKFHKNTTLRAEIRREKNKGKGKGGGR
jgi:hypothetical protein